MRIISSVMVWVVLVTTLAANPAWTQPEPNKSSVAILELEPKGVPESEVSALSDRLRSELINTEAYDVMERGKIQVGTRKMGELIAAAL